MTQTADCQEGMTRKRLGLRLLGWALILASARHIVRESNPVRGSGWQTSIGRELEGRVLGVLGLGNIGGQVARIGLAFGMKVVAWSQNMTPQVAEAAGTVKPSGSSAASLFAAATCPPRFGS
jgi:phosphoglycerate dehydrogenase-like enzyme